MSPPWWKVAYDPGIGKKAKFKNERDSRARKEQESQQRDYCELLTGLTRKLPEQRKLAGYKRRRKHPAWPSRDVRDPESMGIVCVTQSLPRGVLGKLKELQADSVARQLAIACPSISHSLDPEGRRCGGLGMLGS
jgi:hypothetical protein